MSTDGLVYGDAMAFFNMPGPDNPPILKSENLHLACVTAAPPFVSEINKISGIVKKFRTDLESQKNVRVVLSDYNLREIGEGCKVVLGLQHPPVDAPIDLLFNSGVRITQIAYEGENIFGGGFNAPETPLRAAGQEFIRDLARLGMILDLSHAGQRTADDALEFISRNNLKVPVMVSHTGINHIYSHRRNLDIRTLRRVAVMGGFVGIYGLTFGLHDSDNTPQPFLSHLEAAATLLPIDRVGVGSDGVYMEIPEQVAKDQFAKMEVMVNKSGAFKARYPVEAPIFNTPDKLQVIRNMLQKISIASYWADAIVGSNLLRFLYRSLPMRS